MNQEEINTQKILLGLLLKKIIKIKEVFQKALVKKLKKKNEKINNYNTSLKEMIDDAKNGEKKLEELSKSSNSEMKIDENNEIEEKDQITEIERKESDDIISYQIEGNKNI